MKVRLLEKELVKLGYQLKRKRGKGSHRIFTHSSTRKTLTVSGQRVLSTKVPSMKTETIQAMKPLIPLNTKFKTS